MQDELNKLREQLAKSRQHSREWYEMLYTLRRAQKCYDSTLDKRWYVIKQMIEDEADKAITETEKLLYENGNRRQPGEEWENIPDIEG